MLPPPIDDSLRECGEHELNFHRIQVQTRHSSRCSRAQNSLTWQSQAFGHRALFHPHFTRFQSHLAYFHSFSSSCAIQFYQISFHLSVRALSAYPRVYCASACKCIRSTAQLLDVEKEWNTRKEKKRRKRKEISSSCELFSTIEKMNLLDLRLWCLLFYLVGCTRQVLLPPQTKTKHATWIFLRIRKTNTTREY